MILTLRRLTLLLVISVSCIDWSGPDNDTLSFNVSELDLGTTRSVATTLTNNSNRAYGPIDLRATDVVDRDNNPVSGATISIVPMQIATLNPGASQNLTMAISPPPALADGVYQFTVVVRTTELGDVTSLPVLFSINGVAATASVASLSIDGLPASLRQGDAIGLNAAAVDAGNNAVNGAIISWSVTPAGAGFVDQNGQFVGYQPGPVTLTATAGNGSDQQSVDITARALQQSFVTVGQGTLTDRFTSDLWAVGNTVYTGTWGVRAVGNQVLVGNRMYAWETDAGGTLTLQDSVSVDARTVNDVKIRDDGQLAIVTHEGSNDGLNGVTLLDLSDPLHPTVITRITETLTAGVHNAWLDGTFLYLVVDGSGPASGLRVYDVTDPGNPANIASFYAGESFLHDVYVRDGLAFLSHWDAGLIILDVGNGVEGGSPSNPVEVSRIKVPGGQTHNAWYWPATNYVFVGEEDFNTPGILHVIDVSDLHQPREVATMTVPGTTPHNFWLDEAASRLYVSWYANGVRVVDVSGTLTGRLERQGREYAGVQYGGTGTGCSGATNTHTCNWAPQFHNGLLYVSDMNTGLWVLQPTP